MKFIESVISYVRNWGKESPETVETRNPEQSTDCVYSTPRPTATLACNHNCIKCPETTWYLSPVIEKPERWAPGVRLQPGVFDTEESNAAHRHDSLLMCDIAPAAFSSNIRRYSPSNIWVARTSDAIALSNTDDTLSLADASRRLIDDKFKESEVIRDKYDLIAYVIPAEIGVTSPTYFSYISKLLAINGIYNPMSNIQPNLREVGYQNGFIREKVRIKISLGDTVPFTIGLYRRFTDEKGDVNYSDLAHEWHAFNVYELLALLVSLPSNELYQSLAS